MSVIEAIIQGIVQGLTEFLPVSSSGHLSLYQHFTGLSGESGLLFSIILHVGTLVAVIAAFYRLIWALILEFFRMIKDIFTGKFRWKDRNPERNMVLMIILALVPLAIIYVLLGDVYAAVSTDQDILVEGICFLVTSGLLFFADRHCNGTKGNGDITPRDALVVGTLQAIAPLPGVSRSGSTIASGLMCGLSKETAVSFSFILGIPAILGGSVMELKDVTPADMNLSVGVIIVGLITSAVVGFLSIKMVQWLLKSDRFKIFAIYTLILGIVVVGIGIYEHISGTHLMLAASEFCGAINL
jgi:undecaprenyl-diphosphatase